MDSGSTGGEGCHWSKRLVSVEHPHVKVASHIYMSRPDCFGPYVLPIGMAVWFVGCFAFVYVEASLSLFWPICSADGYGSLFRCRAVYGSFDIVQDLLLRPRALGLLPRPAFSRYPPAPGAYDLQ